MGTKNDIKKLRNFCKVGQINKNETQPQVLVNAKGKSYDHYFYLISF